MTSEGVPGMQWGGPQQQLLQQTRDRFCQLLLQKHMREMEAAYR